MSNDSMSVALDRPLIAFAFLAQAANTEGDLLGKLAPLFKLIAKNKVGRRFDPAEFAKEIAKLFFIDVHPWAAEDLAPRLEKANLLTKRQLPAGAHDYIYAPVDADFNEVSEADIRLTVRRFVEFATPMLQSHGLSVNEKELENGLFGQLIKMDFVSTLQKAPTLLAEPGSADTLSVKKTSKEVGTGVEAIRIDVLCASFVLHAYREEREIYELLVKIASGALVAETVLNFQNPSGAITLNKLTFVLDAPFIMALMNLESLESHEYAKKICETLRTHGATLGAFRHSAEEIKDNIAGAITLSAEGKGFGATARRLSSPSFAQYANAVRADPEAAIAAIGMRLVALPQSTSAYAQFSAEDEESFHGTLGRYGNPVAQLRDAASIASVVRLRFGKRVRMTSLPNASYIFVTANPFLAQKAQEFLTRAKILADDEVPAAVTDKYLAGLLLVLFGGQAAEFTHIRLLANCASALEAKNDVINKMHKFLVQVGREEADRFRALMTVERAGQHLMQLTLGDSLFITDSNAPHILAELERVLIENQRIKYEADLKEVRKQHNDQIADVTKGQEELQKQALEAQAEAMLAREGHRLADERLQALQQKFESSQAEHAEKVRKRIIQAMGIANNVATFGHHVLAVASAAIGAYLAYIGMSPLSHTRQILVAIGVGAIALVSFWKAPDYLFAWLLRRIRDHAFVSVTALFGLSDELGRYEVDWHADQARHKDAPTS
jgi:hypothetical protein